MNCILTRANSTITRLLSNIIEITIIGAYLFCGLAANYPYLYLSMDNAMLDVMPLSEAGFSASNAATLMANLKAVTGTRHNKRANRGWHAFQEYQSFIGLLLCLICLSIFVAARIGLADTLGLGSRPSHLVCDCMRWVRVATAR